METALISPAKALILGVPSVIFSVIIPLVGISIFIYIMMRRIAPIVKASPDHRFNHIFDRIIKLIKIWLFQYRQPRYMLAGVLHILIFAGFLILSIRSTSLVVLGFWDGFLIPGFGGALGHIYNFVKDYAATWVLIACIIAAIRRGIFKPERYAVPEKYGHDHTGEAVFVLGLISLLMISESLFEASLVAAQTQSGVHAEFLPPLTIGWFFSKILSDTSLATLQNTHLASYFLHDVTFFFFLCFLPLGKHFHVITSVFNVFFMRLDAGTIKPVRYGVDEDKL
ncbi:MAG: electron transfer flavoprotein, partial [Deltaproteobacteria bacterium]|nr:electron transfer flavoprotein [Deltaproteobacteria bacterium]